MGMLEPSGWQIQLDGTYTAPSGTEGFDPEYCSTSCESSPSPSPTPTPPSPPSPPAGDCSQCKSVVQKECSGDVGPQCMNCVFRKTKSFQSEGCNPKKCQKKLFNECNG